VKASKLTKPVIILGAIALINLILCPASVEAYDKGQPHKVSPPTETKAWVPVRRTTEKIVRVEQDVMKFKDDTWQLDFYRNNAYKCGLSGNYTFLVVEPRNNPGKEAPLWLFFHGGGNGYFDADGIYRTLKWQNKDTWNHESSLDVLLGKINPVRKGRFIDHTLSRRLKEGYRLLVVSYGDHDVYSGMGTPYPNNPKGGQVNGLQASMAAVEYTVAHYPTTHVFAHGTSAGSTGSYSLGFAFAQEGTNLTGVVMDSNISTPRRTPIHLAMAANNSRIVPKKAVEIFGRESKWLGYPRGLIEKVGVMIDPEYPFIPEAAVRAGYNSVPMLIIAGTKDPFFGGSEVPTIAEARAAGMGNVQWMWEGMRQAIEQQKDSPHKLVMLNTGHVPTNKEGNRAHDEVDAFIRQAVSARPSYPFKETAISLGTSHL